MSYDKNIIQTMIKFSIYKSMSGNKNYTFYCQRSSIEKDLLSILEKHKIVYVSGSPKLGKTIFAKNLANSLKKTYPIYVNLKHVQDYQDLQSRIIKGIIEALIPTSSINDILTKFNSFDARIITNSYKNVSEVSVPRVKRELSAPYIQQLLPIKNSPLWIFDNCEDFLSLSELDVKKFNELLKNLLGSCLVIENTNVFANNEHSTKLENVHNYNFPAITNAEYFGYIQKLFSNKKISISSDTYYQVLNKSGDFLGDNHTLFLQLLNMKDIKQLDSFIIEDALLNVISHSEEIFEIIYQGLTPIQKSFLRCLAEDRNIKLYGKEFSDKAGFDAPVHPNTVDKTLKALISYKILYKDGKNHKFFNPFLKEWIFKNFRY